MLFLVCRKLISQQLANGTEVLKWLREILICRNKFLLKNKVRSCSKIPLTTQTQLCVHLSLPACGFNACVCVFLPHRSRSVPRWVVGSPSAGRRRPSWRFVFTCSCGVQTPRRCSWPCRVFDTFVRRRTSEALLTKCLSRTFCQTTPPSVNSPLLATWWEQVSTFWSFSS